MTILNILKKQFVGKTLRLQSAGFYYEFVCTDIKILMPLSSVMAVQQFTFTDDKGNSYDVSARDNLTICKYKPNGKANKEETGD